MWIFCMKIYVCIDNVFSYLAIGLIVGLGVL